MAAATEGASEAGSRAVALTPPWRSSGQSLRSRDYDILLFTLSRVSITRHSNKCSTCTENHPHCAAFLFSSCLLSHSTCSSRHLSPRQLATNNDIDPAIKITASPV